MLKYHQIALGFLLASAIWVVLLALQSDPSAYHQICETNQHTGKESCSSHHIPYIVLWYIGHWFDKASAVITAFATVAIATFTVVLARVSRRQAEITREALTHTDRAFVFVEKIDYSFLADKTTGQIKSWKFIPHWQNSGNTPTVRMMNRMAYQLRRNELPPDFDFPDAGSGPAGHTLIAPKSIMHGSHFDIAVEDLSRIAKGDWFAYVWGWADYDDVFEGTARHRTEFCFQIVVGADPTRTDCRFYFRVAGRFNGSENECYRRPGSYISESLDMPQ